MIISNGLPELLAPAGDMKALVGAIEAGADAVYVGGKKFGARAFAKNFDDEELKTAVELCHSRGVRLYVTVNTLIYQKELADALSYVGMLSDIGVDALIVCDLGLIKLIREKYPHMELHASTQMGIHNSIGADEAYSLGCKRVVIARECSFEDIKSITEKCKAEVEIFIHGALCVCHSGQCLFSSLVGGRSGNRGECAQPCRLPFGKGNYPLSLKDLTLASHVRELLKAGVASLKIEGRMKSFEYVSTVTSIFRQLLDEKRDATEWELERLERAFSRGGFTDGYFKGKTESGMTGVRTEEAKQISRELKMDEPSLQKLTISASAKFKKDAPCELALWVTIKPRYNSYNDTEICISASASGRVPTEAINSPLDEQSLKARLCKMGNTPFSLLPDNISIELDEGLNLSPSEINSLRREAAEKLQRLLLFPLSKEKKELISVNPLKSDQTNAFNSLFEKNSVRADFSGKMILSFRDLKLLRRLLAQKSRLIASAYRIFIPLVSFSELGRSERADIVSLVGADRLGVILPPVIAESELSEVLRFAKNAAAEGIKCCLAGNIGHLPLCRRLFASALADIRLNVFNPSTLSALRELGIDFAIPSAELTLSQAKDIGGFLFAMGRIPLMLTERCFIKESLGCRRCDSSQLIDRRGARFPIMREYKHRNIIMNSAMTYMGDKRGDIDGAGLGVYISFTTEDYEKAKSLADSFLSEKELKTEIRRVGKR